ncbi:MAG TPA: lactate racemase domain-containing protein, partial [Candidatus Krumholzibacterium sp.]|nr:lactate racemase domain-containing protein [Candidatus Krumholzibacterium sp.]
ISDRLGNGVTQRFRVIQHDACDESSLIRTGATSAGTECLFNERVVDSGLVIGLGQISFHYFAGFGGSRKLILPGIAGESTILQNHRLSLAHDAGEGLQENCQPGRLDGNPVHEDMLEGAGTLPAPVFMINSVMGDGTVPAFVNGGDMESSHLRAVDWFRERFTFSFDEPYKAVVASAGGTPGDVDLLQSHKAVRYAATAVDQGGLLLMASACREGTGSTSLEECFKDGREGVPGRVRAGYTLNSQTAMSIYDLTGRMSIYLRSRMEGRQVGRFGFIPWEDGYERYLLEGIGPEDILVVMNAAGFLPVQS